MNSNPKNAFTGFGSPHNSGMRSNQSSASPYLPGYLLGNSPQIGQHQDKHLSSTLNYSSSKVQQKWNSKSPPHITRMPYSSPEQQWKRTSPKSISPNIRSSMKDKHGGPPTEGLFSPVKVDELAMETELSIKPNIYNSPVTKDILSASSYRSPDVKRGNIFNENDENIPQSPAQIDPFYTQGDDIRSDDVLDDTSVTVFGFPSAAATYILQQFSQYGTIEKYDMHNTGNWVHIKYKTKIQAKKALSKNGKIFSRTIMIGVLPCVKKSIAESNLSMNFSMNMSEQQQILVDKSQNSMRPLSTSSSVLGNNTTPMRNLSTGSHLSTEKGTPQKQNSVVTKALDYVFGW